MHHQVQTISYRISQLLRQTGCQLLLISALLLTVASSAQESLAQIPQQIAYQGQLIDESGELADGEYAMTFRIYNVPEGGAALWSEAQAVVVANGIFNVMLGKEIPLNLSFDEPYWLGVQVGNTEQTPRIELAATPYSFMATRAKLLPEPDFDSGWFIMQSQVGADSFKEIEHNLGDYPSTVKVLVRAIDGDNNGFIFEGMGSAQNDDDSGANSSYGGVIFAYDQTRVRLWAPDQNNGNDYGRIIHVFDGWGGEINRQNSNAAEVKVLVWK
jgi:hypothetical protein